MVNICPLCDEKFKTLDPGQRHCTKCLEEIAYMLVTGKFKSEVAADRRLVN